LEFPFEVFFTVAGFRQKWTKKQEHHSLGRTKKRAEERKREKEKNTCLKLGKKASMEKAKEKKNAQEGGKEKGGTWYKDGGEREWVQSEMK